MSEQPRRRRRQQIIIEEPQACPNIEEEQATSLTLDESKVEESKDIVEKNASLNLETTKQKKHTNTKKSKTIPLVSAIVLLIVVIIGVSVGVVITSSPVQKYNAAQRLMAEGKYDKAAEKFEELGSYEDATTLAMYCKACSLCESGNYSTGITVLEAMGDYKDCAMRIMYYQARSYEDFAGDDYWEYMAKAKAIYETIPVFLDSAGRITALNERIEATKAAQYNAAVEAGENADYVTALNGFERLGGYKDSEKRYTYYTIRKNEDAVSDSTNQDKVFAVANEYKNMGTYLDCTDRAITLCAKADTIIADKYAHVATLIAEGKYVDAESILVSFGTYGNNKITENYYNIAEKYFLESKWDKALAAFEKAGTYRDGEKWAKYCEARLAENGIDFLSYGLTDGKVKRVQELYENLSDFNDSRIRARALLCKRTELFPDSIRSFNNGFARVMKDEKYGYIDTAGNLVIEPQWENAGDFSEGLASVKINGKWGYTDTSGNLVIEPQWESTWNFSEGLANVEINGKWGYIDTSGNLVIEPQWESARLFSEGLAAVEINGKWGYINIAGDIVIEPQWESADDFSEGLAAVEINGKWGYINIAGDIVIEPQWESAGDFSEGLASVLVSGRFGYSKSGYIDTTGDLVIEPKWVWANNFSEGLAAVSENYLNVGEKYIDRTGKVVLESGEWENVFTFSNGLASVQSKASGKYGYIDNTGNYVIDPQWYEAYSFNDGFAVVNNRHTIIDTNGNIIFGER